MINVVTLHRNRITNSFTEPVDLDWEDKYKECTSNEQHFRICLSALPDFNKDYR